MEQLIYFVLLSKKKAVLGVTIKKLRLYFILRNCHYCSVHNKEIMFM